MSYVKSLIFRQTGSDRAKERLNQHRKIWKNTPSSDVMTRQRRRYAKRRELRELSAKENELLMSMNTQGRRRA